MGRVLKYYFSDKLESLILRYLILKRGKLIDMVFNMWV